MAIENIWIIDSNSGICIFDWCHESKVKTIDEQLVSGLLLAFRNFSSEAGLVDISAIEGIDRKLAYKSDDRFIIASICHSKDYEPLVNRTLLNLLHAFRNKYRKLLDTGVMTDVSPFRTFEEDIINSLEDTTATRNFTTTLVGAITGMVIIGIIFVTYALTIKLITDSIPEGGAVVGLIMLLIGFIIAGFFGGLIAGERRYGIYASLVFIIPVYAIFMAFYSREWLSSLTIMIFYTLLYFLLFSIFSFTGGIIGGYTKERRYLYPITTATEAEEQLKEKMEIEYTNEE
ncbi:MAG: YrzE family protein [Candidatus Heimdallarchaeota archaeon]|nr:YrzE family protein [Candidatus Heimdallarchaeota archaeon]